MLSEAQMGAVEHSRSSCFVSFVALSLCGGFRYNYFRIFFLFCAVVVVWGPHRGEFACRNSRRKWLLAHLQRCSSRGLREDERVRSVARGPVVHF